MTGGEDVPDGSRRNLGDGAAASDASQDRKADGLAFDALLAVAGAAAGIVIGFVALSGFDVRIRLWTAITVILLVLTSVSARRAITDEGASAQGSRRPLVVRRTAVAAMATLAAAVGIPLMSSATIDVPIDLGRVNPSATFTIPGDGDPVESPFLARGSADMPADQSLWILTRPENNKYYTNNRKPLTIDPEGRWEYRMGIGQGRKDKDRRFDLFLVSGAAGETKIEESFRDHPDKATIEFDALPEGVTIRHNVHVRLRVP